MHIARTAAACGIAALFVQLAPAQSLNLSTGGAAAAPSSGYGAASGQVGAWNAVRWSYQGPAQPLFDLAGAPTAAVAYVCDNCCDATGPDRASSDDELLLFGMLNGDCYASPGQLDLIDLEGGSYQLWLYGYNVMAPSTTQGLTVKVRDGANQVTHTEVSLTGGVVFDGQWPGFPVGRQSFDVDDGGRISVTIQSSGVYGGLAGLQLVKLDAGNVAFCSGHLGDCPCGVGESGHGCPSSFDPAGAELVALGTASVAADDVLLRITGTSNTYVSFFQSGGFAGGGYGSLFGDGLLCLAAPVQRLGIRLAAGNVAEFPPPATATLAQRGGLPPAGGLRTYQAWYRNQAPGYCTAARFNLTNGVALSWQP